MEGIRLCQQIVAVYCQKQRIGKNLKKWFAIVRQKSGTGLFSVMEDQDKNKAELVYKEWETDQQMQIDNAEADHPR